LAFQGGGAKGLAYVGVYKALRENPTIPIRTVIGSSAGGIFALAVSTGISPYELLQICCKMKDIPKKDRFDQTSELYDENGKLVLLSNS
jgi:predicted acylesterase/phospholipase RssA